MYAGRAFSDGPSLRPGRPSRRKQHGGCRARERCSAASAGRDFLRVGQGPCVETRERWLEADSYPNVDHVEDLRKDSGRPHGRRQTGVPGPDSGPLGHCPRLRNLVHQPRHATHTVNG